MCDNNMLIIIIIIIIWTAMCDGHQAKRPCSTRMLDCNV